MLASGLNRSDAQNHAVRKLGSKKRANPLAGKTVGFHEDKGVVNASGTNE